MREVLRVARAAALSVAAALLLASLAGAAPGDPKALVLRGRVLDGSARPVAGARVVAKGTLTMTALTDDQGRYTLMMSMGTPAALLRDPFTLEVRAEGDGGRVPFRGADALKLEVALGRGVRWALAHVTANDEELARVVAASFGQEGPVTATYVADFGAKGVLAKNASDDSELYGVVNPGGRAPAETHPAVPGRRAADSLAAARAADRAAEAAARAAVERARRDSAAAERLARWRADSVRTAEKRAEKQREDERVRAEAAARRDSLAAARREQKRADSLAWVERHRKPAAPASLPRAGRSDPEPGEIIATVDTTPKPLANTAAPAAPGERRVVGRSPADPPTLRDPRIVAIRPEDGPPVPPPAGDDSCVCRVRGTVEIDWGGRPREQRVPVRVTLSGPAVQQQDLQMFMGAPREFVLGPLPCGEYSLIAAAGGRLRFLQAPTGRPLTVRCAGWTQVRVVLEPERR